MITTTAPYATIRVEGPEPTPGRHTQRRYFAACDACDWADGGMTITCNPNASERTGDPYGVETDSALRLALRDADAHNRVFHTPGQAPDAEKTALAAVVIGEMVLPALRERLRESYFYSAREVRMRLWALDKAVIRQVGPRELTITFPCASTGRTMNNTLGTALIEGLAEYVERTPIEIPTFLGHIFDEGNATRFVW